MTSPFPTDRSTELEEGARLSGARRLPARGRRRGAAADAACDRLDLAHRAVAQADAARAFLSAHLPADGRARRQAAVGRGGGMSAAPVILVDADACPVTEEVYRVERSDGGRGGK